jgi:hypothetical protein
MVIETLQRRFLREQRQAMLTSNFYYLVARKGQIYKEKLARNNF